MGKQTWEAGLIFKALLYASKSTAVRPRLLDLIARLSETIMTEQDSHGFVSFSRYINREDGCTNII